MLILRVAIYILGILRHPGSMIKAGVPLMSPPPQIYPAPAGQTDPSTWQTRKLATAIYPTMALLNHSCDNNVTKYFVGSRWHFNRNCFGHFDSVTCLKLSTTVNTAYSAI